MSKGSKPIAFVPPRYGSDVVGGAEAVIADFAHGLAALGHEVEILTTCARDHYTWANHYPAGTTAERGVTVRRFPTDTSSSGVARDRIGHKILTGAPVTIDEQQLWMNDSLRVPELWHHVLDRREEFRAIVLAPYMFWTTFAVGQIAPERTVLMPCLHDEPTAHLDLFQPLFSDARAMIFLSEPEAELARSIFRLPPRTDIVGAGIELPEAYHPERFIAAHGIDRPFVFFAGRREWGKGWTDLLAAFDKAVSGGADLVLVTAGVGSVEAPPSIADRVVDLGFISDEERNDAMAAAAAYVQPSPLESFSRTILEAMAAGTPVVANARSEVVSWHLDRSGAGIRYHSDDELVEALHFVADMPAAAAALARSGREYVESHYDPAAIIDRLASRLDEWLPVS